MPDLDPRDARIAELEAALKTLGAAIDAAIHPEGGDAPEHLALPEVGR